MAATRNVPVRVVADRVLDRQLREVSTLRPVATVCPLCRERERRLLERVGRVKRARRVWLGRTLVSLLFLALFLLAWWRLGSPTASVMLQEGGR